MNNIELDNNEIYFSQDTPPIICSNCYRIPIIEMNDNDEISLRCQCGNNIKTKLKDYIDSIKNKIKIPSCDIVSHEKREAVEYCIQCKQYYCARCISSHIEYNKERPHKSYPISFFKCFLHKKQITYYCEYCKEDFCNLCLPRHIGHHYLSIESIKHKIKHSDKQSIENDIKRYLIATRKYSNDTPASLINVYNVCNTKRSKRKFTKGINCLCFLKDGRLAVGFNSSEIMILGINNDTIDLRINIHSQAVTHFLATDKNELISCSFDGTIRIIEVEENRYRETRQFNYNTPLTYMITNNSKIIASSINGHIIIYDINERNNNKEDDIYIDNFPIRTIVLLKEDLIAIGSETQIIVYNIKTKTKVESNYTCFGSGSMCIIDKSKMLISNLTKVYIIQYDNISKVITKNEEKTINENGFNCIAKVPNQKVLLCGTFNGEMLSYSIKENKFELLKMQIKKNSPITSIAVKDKVIAYSYEEGSIILI